MNFNSQIGLRGKLSILICAAVLVIGSVLTFYSSRFLSDGINKRYQDSAQTISSFLEASLVYMHGMTLAQHMQGEIDSVMVKAHEIDRISVYAPGKNGIINIASSDHADVGLPALAAESVPLLSGNSQAPSTAAATGAVAAKMTGATIQPANFTTGKLTQFGEESITSLHDHSGRIIASVGIYLNTAERDHLIRSQQIQFAIIINLSLLALVIMLYFALNRMLIKPVKQLTKATSQMSEEDYEHTPVLKRRDELGDLAQEFRKLALSLKTRDEEVGLLFETAAAVSSTLKVDRILQTLCDKIASSQRVSYCRIAMLDQHGCSLTVKAASPTRKIKWNYGLGEKIGLQEAPHHCSVLETGKPVILRKYTPSSIPSADEKEWALTQDTRAAVLLPLKSKQEIVGVVILGEVESCERTPLSEKKIELYQTLLDQAAVTIDNARLYEKTEWHVQELSALHNMSQAFTSTLNYQDVIRVVAMRVGSLIEAQFASVLLPDAGGRFLSIVASFNLSAEYIWAVNKKQRIPLNKGPIGDAFSQQRPVFVENVLSDPGYEPWKHMASVQGYSSLVALPLMAKDESIGVICIYFAEPRLLNSDEIELLTTAANEAAIAIENSRIFNDLQEAFVGTIRSLAETIDAKDTYTRGHSEKVSLYGEAIARSLGLSSEEVVTIRYAGYLHDVGKIGIPDEILRKPGKLSLEEFHIIKKHPVLSERILKPVGIPFPIQPIVRHHHERYDGRGYPDGLVAEEIPLGARILFVADAYEAMTSDRPYRKALSVQRALSELVNNKGAQFDPKVVDAFINVITAGEKGQNDEAMRMGA